MLEQKKNKTEEMILSCRFKENNQQGLFRLIGILIISIYCVSSAVAEVSLPHIFNDNMVLQRNQSVPVWGKAASGEKITVSFAGQKKSCTASGDGRWMLTLDSMKANAEPQEMIISGSNRVALKNILVGEVWLCSGDFGVYLEMFKCKDAVNEIKKARFPGLRLLTVASKSSNKPLYDIEALWVECLPEKVSAFSGIAYYFGRKLHQELKVPVGVISASYRYSSIRSWLSPESIRSTPELKTLKAKLDSWDVTTEKGRQAHLAAIKKMEAWLPVAEKAFAEGKPVPKQPLLPAPLPPVDNNYLSLGELCNLYYGMISPISPYALRGVVWSQGENGFGRPALLTAKTEALVTGWRKLWGQESLPFYLEMLPKVGPVKDIPCTGLYWAESREEQIKALLLKGTYMAVTLDVADFGLDARNRKDPGERLALSALANEYGVDVVFSGPKYKSFRIDGEGIVVSFDNIEGGLIVGEKIAHVPVKEIKNGTLKQFVIAGEDKKWHWADAKIKGKTVVVSSQDVKSPVAVRYAWSANPDGCNLYNKEGLLAEPFRTDAW